MVPRDPGPGAARTTVAAADAADADDPVTASYDVFLNPALPLGRRLLVLQQPNRTDGGARAPPAELRLKSDSGMVEVDVPLDTAAAYDRAKGLRWGRALRSSMAVKSGGCHGLAGGFGFGAVQPRAAAHDDDRDDGTAHLDWNDAVSQDKVLRTQTLGGQYPDADEIQYMVGVFHGKDLHLTPVSSLVLLRPQLHHLDAAAQQERSAASAAASSAKDASAAGSATAARAIHMTIKTTADGDAVTTETMADRLRFVQSEPWRKLRHTDDNDEAAWDVYNESLFLRAPPATAAAADALADDRRLDHLVSRFASKWRDKRLLEAVSGITKPEPAPEPEAPAVEPRPEPRKDKQPGPEAKRPRARPRGASAAAATRRGSRAKAPVPTVDLD